MFCICIIIQHNVAIITKAKYENEKGRKNKEEKIYKRERSERDSLVESRCYLMQVVQSKIGQTSTRVFERRFLRFPGMSQVRWLSKVSLSLVPVSKELSSAIESWNEKKSFTIRKYRSSRWYATVVTVTLVDTSLRLKDTSLRYVRRKYLKRRSWSLVCRYLRVIQAR